MAEPGDPRNPDDDDALVGFASAESLAGRPRQLEPTPEPAPGPATVEPPAAEQDQPRTRPVQSIFEPSPGFAMRGSRPEPGPEPVVGGVSQYAVYALILFAVPTLGVSALIGLVAVTGRPGPEEPDARTHFIYQQRTLWAAAVVAVAGLILLAAPFALGVPVLFALALWTVIRGAAGVWALKAGRPIADPRGWWI